MFSANFRDLSKAFDSCVYTTQEREIQEGEAFNQMRQMIYEVSAKKGIVYVIGNGGSAGIASHFSNDLMKALKISSQTLYDVNLLTCLANDIGYENVFSYPLKQMMNQNDLLIAISSSGKSLNIVNAAAFVKSIKATLITFTGFSQDNPLRRMGDLNFWVDRCHYGLVEVAHFFLLHTVVDLWNKTLFSAVEYDQIS